MRDDVHVLRFPEPIPGSYDLAFDGWADDVSVDFPSMASLVDRMQAAFFAGERGAPPVGAEVQLTERHAVSGGRVAVEVPVRRSCRRCAGRGEISDQACAACGGTGDREVLELVHVFVPAGVRDGTRFRLRVRATEAAHTAVDLIVRVR
jgi:hypothetical protein